MGKIMVKGTVKRMAEIAGILCVLLLLMLSAFSGVASAETYRGTCGAEGDGSNLTWSLDTETGVLEISGSGAMVDFLNNDMPWYSNTDSIKALKINFGVTRIGYMAFSGCSSLVSVTIDNSMTGIENYAFYGCSSLRSITIPNSVISIGNYVFDGCSSLERIIIPNSVTRIGSHTFDNCSTLKAIDVNVSNKTYSSIDGILFSKNKVELIKYPEGITQNSYIIPASVTNIGSYAFYNCRNLVNITISENVTSIGGGGFSFCSSLCGITIPDSVTSMGSSVFRGCDQFISAGPIDGGYDIEFGWSEAIPANAFYGCSSLVSITIPDSVNSIGNYSFGGCSSLASILIPDGVISLGSYVFYGCNALASVTLPVNITKIGDCTFRYCDSLTSITIPDSLFYIGAFVFEECNNLRKVYFHGAAPNVYSAASSYNSFQTTATLYFISGKSGWTMPTWEGYNTATWDPGSKEPNYNTATINYQGYAYGWYTMLDVNDKPLPSNVVIEYQFDGYSKICSALTGENGLICIKSPYLTESTALQVAFCRRDGGELSTTSNKLDVTVTDLAFTQKWAGRLSQNGSASLGLEAGAKVGIAEAEAKAASVNGKIGLASSIELELENTAQGQKNLTIVTAMDANLAAKTEVGLWANAKTSIGSVAKISAGETSGTGSIAADNSLGLKISDYNPANNEQNIKIGSYLLESGATTNVVIQKILKKLNLNSYNEISNGYTVDLAANASLGEVKLDINNDGNALSTSLVGLGAKTLYTHEEKSNSDNTTTISSSVLTDAGYSILNGLKNDSDGQASGYDASVNLGDSLFGQKFLSNNISLSAKLSANGNLQKIRLKSVDAQTSKNLLIKKTVNNSYYTVDYTGSEAKEINNSSRAISGFVARENSLLSASDFKNIVLDMNNNEVQAVYNKSSEDKIDYYLPIEISAKAVLGLGVGFGIGGFTSNECAVESGVIVGDKNYVSSQSDSAAAAAENATTLGEIVGTAFQAAWDSVAGFFVDVKDKAVNGVKNGLAAIGNTTADWSVKITSWVDDNIRVQAAESFDILAVTSDEADLAATAVAATVGEFYLIEATNENDEAITDFSSNPLPLTLGYTDDMLIAAGADSSMLANLAIYYWDVERQVYQYIGGVVDAAAQTVFAEITKAGQYILAIDNCAPTIVDFTVSDSSASPTISANVTDLSGLAEFSFVLDDNELVTKDNLDDYYNYQNGYFSYEAADLSEGEHRAAIFAKDAAGNAMTEPVLLTFVTDATLPVISDFTVAEYITSDSAAFTVNASDTSLSQVKLHISFADQFGNTNNAAVIMEEIDGAYVAEVSDLPVGCTLQSWITATDAAGNTAESAKKNSIVLCGAGSENYVTVTKVEQETITLYAGNTAGTQLAGRVIAAIYNEEGQMTAVKSREVNTAAPAAITLNMGIDLSEDTDLKVFFVGSDSQVPLCEFFAVNQ